MPATFQRCASALAAAAIVLASVVACSGGDAVNTADTNAPATVNSGTVGILLTDKPADPALFASVNATISQVELIGDDDDGNTILYSGDPKTVDLLRLKNESVPFTFHDDVPVGTYCKIRLTLDSLEVVLTDGSKEYPNLSGNGKLDLLASDCFEVAPGEVITLQLDIDAGNSIHIVENGKGYSFRPVVRVDVVNTGFDAKLVRITGAISEIDDAGTSLILCGLPVYGTSSEKCATVMIGDDSAFFDNVTYDGEPRPLSELLTTDMVGQAVTVVGWPQRIAVPVPYDDDDDDSGSDDAASEDSDDGDDHTSTVMALDALVIESGAFLTLEGSAADDADEYGFAMDVSNGPLQIDGALPVVLQAGTADYRGTRVVSRSGDLLDYTAVLTPRALSVDGVLVIPNDELRAALVIVDTESDDDRISGTVLAVTGNSFTLSSDVMACNIAGDIVVEFDDETQFTTVIIRDDSSEIHQDGEPMTGQLVGLGGECTASGYFARTIVIVDDQRS